MKGHMGKKKRAEGGKVDAYAGGDSNIAKAAKSTKTIGVIAGEKGENRLDRPKRASGGAVKMPKGNPANMGPYGDGSAKALKGSGGSPFTKAHSGEDDRQLDRARGGKC